MAKTKAEKIAKRENKKAERTRRDSLHLIAEKTLQKLTLRNKKHQQQGTLLEKKKPQDIWWYYKRMLGETKELQRAMKRFDITPDEVTREAVISECCDVANLVGAIAENVWSK